MAINAERIRQLVSKYPIVASSLVGAAAGAPVGAAFSEEGVEDRGAMQGALLGGLGGAVAGPSSRLAIKIMPSKEKALALGGAVGGTLGGLLGQRKLSPWVMEHLKELARTEAANPSKRKGKKEASAMGIEQAKEELEKEAQSEKEAAGRTLSFDYGMELFCNQAGVTKDEFSKAAGVANPDNLTQETLACLSDLIRNEQA